MILKDIKHTITYFNYNYINIFPQTTKVTPISTCCQAPCVQVLVHPPQSAVHVQLITALCKTVPSWQVCTTILQYYWGERREH